MPNDKKELAYVLKEHGKCIGELRRVAKMIRMGIYDELDMLTTFRDVVSKITSTGFEEIDRFNGYAIQSITSDKVRVKPQELVNLLYTLFKGNPQEAATFLHGLASVLDEDDCGYAMHEVLLFSGKRTAKDDTTKLLAQWKENAKNRQRWNHLSKETLNSYLAHKDESF